MPRLTERNDWLSNAIALYEGEMRCFVSGSLVFSRRHFDMATPVVLRVAAHFPRNIKPPQKSDERKGWLPSHYVLMMGLLTVETEVVPSGESLKKLSQFAKWLENQLNTPVALVFYSPQENEAGLPTLFWVLDRQLGQNGVIDPIQYANNINEYRKPYEWDIPPLKQINKSENDLFQRWTRAYLTPQLSINDIDAFFYRSKPPHKLFLLEVKRSSIHGWQPFLDDVPNFMLLRACALAGDNALECVLRMDQRNDTWLECHILTTVSWAGITGFKKVIYGNNGETLWLNTVVWLDSLADEIYTSRTKRRIP